MRGKRPGGRLSFWVSCWRRGWRRGFALGERVRGRKLVGRARPPAWLLTVWFRQPRGPRPRPRSLPRQMVGGHPSRTCPGSPGRPGPCRRAEGRLRCLAVSVPCRPHLQLPAGRGRCPVRRNPLPLGPGSLPAPRGAPQKLSGLCSPAGTSPGGPHSPWVANWAGRVALPGNPLPVPAGLFGLPRLCCLRSPVVVRDSSRAGSPTRWGSRRRAEYLHRRDTLRHGELLGCLCAGAGERLRAGTPDTPVGVEGCGGHGNALSLDPISGPGEHPTPGQEQPLPASGVRGGYTTPPSPIFHIALYHPVRQTGCLPHPWLGKRDKKWSLPGYWNGGEGLMGSGTHSGLTATLHADFLDLLFKAGRHTL